jgi:pimeloyl-ACP methyl ester carboxylesterase
MDNISIQPIGADSRSELGGVPVSAYVLDAFERSLLFLDTLRRRGNSYVEHRDAGAPPLLTFDHELVMDGSTLPRPCNYALLRILPHPDCPVDPRARPVVVVDPRAGHGAGIGGFKRESEVGMAMRAGHPVYFVTFRPQPEDGQTLADVLQAEAVFLEVVVARHTQCATKPLVIGNCQAGWAMAELAAEQPELFGVLFVIGAPLSYWAGSSKLNPMRYSGAMLGGAWLAALASDLGADRFDGANLVHNFEKLNPAASMWSKYFRLWSQVDTEAGRFLEFERWWGGFFRMTGAEIESIVESRFVGNRLAPGCKSAGEEHVDLRNITAPVVVFASWGDNITPPPQALNWIIDTWGDERAIIAAGRVIVYVLHDSVGHLGLFVGAEVARKEHDQLVASLDVIESLPPGLYEMTVRLKDHSEAIRWEDLEPGSYTVQFEHRTMDALRAINPEGRDEEQLFSTVAKVSQINTALYKTWVRPWLRPLCLRPIADAATHLHPLRWQRQACADANSPSSVIAAWAERVRAQRHSLPEDHPGRQWERAVSICIESSLNLYRDLRDQSVVQWTRLFFGPMGFGAWLPPDPPQEALAVARAKVELDEVRCAVLKQIGEGGIAQAVCRVVLAGMVSTGSFERRSLRVAQLLAALPPDESALPVSAVDWRQLMREQARIIAVAPIEALNEVARMLPDTGSRERALAVAAAVMMIEPTLHNPRSEIIELLIGMLNVDPDRVMNLARELTVLIVHPAPPTATPLGVASSKPAPGVDLAVPAS